MTPQIPRLSNGRDDNGRFALGNVGGPGNPNARTAHKWRERLAGIVTDADFDAIIHRLVIDAVPSDKVRMTGRLDFHDQSLRKFVFSA